MNILSDLLLGFSTETGLIVVIVALLLADILVKGHDRRWFNPACLMLTALLLAAHIFTWGRFGTYVFGTIVQDPLSYFFKGFFLLCALYVILMSREYTEKFERAHQEFYLLVLLATLGMVVLSCASDFILLFVSLELVTVSFYIMTTYLRSDAKSIEAGLKYLILGALSSGFLLYGISYLYGLTGSTQFAGIAAVHGHNPLAQKGILFGFLLVLAGVGFKIASVPFQFWVPDVYEGAPTPVTAFLSVGSKAAGFVILTRIIYTVFPQYQGEWVLLIGALSAMSLLYGNLGAIPQKNIKRFLGYSSIGHAGYLLMGYAAGTAEGLGAALYYLASYLFTNLGAFFIVIIFSKATNSDDISDYAGLSKRSPFLAASMFLALMSLAGIPPLAGFFGKFLLISSAVESGLIWLAFLGAVNVIISLYYYLVIVKRMYIHEPATNSPIPVSMPMRAGIISSVAGMIVLGVFQGPFVRLVMNAAKGLF